MILNHCAVCTKKYIDLPKSSKIETTFPRVKLHLKFCWFFSSNSSRKLIFLKMPQRLKSFVEKQFKRSTRIVAWKKDKLEDLKMGFFEVDGFSALVGLVHCQVF